MTDVASNTLERLMRESEWLRALPVRLVDDPTEADDVVEGATATLDVVAAPAEDR